jgi:hypothetical protein
VPNADVEATYADRSTGRVFPDARAMVNAYIERFAERSGRAMPPLDADGYSSLRKGSAVVGVNVIDDKGVLLLVAPVMPVPASRREELYRRLLELSFLHTEDAAFAVDAPKDEVFVRAYRRLSGLDYEEFEDLVTTVANVADTWDDVLKREFG